MKCVTTNNRFLAFLLIFSLFQMLEVAAKKVGSDHNPSKESRVEFLEPDPDNMMSGFAAFENGFLLQNSRTTCTFKSPFPVSGDIDLGVGTLYLFKDLVFDENANLINMGHIYGNGNKIRFSDSVTTLTAYSSGVNASSSVLSLVDRVDMGSIIKSIDWSYDDGYIVSSRYANSFKAYEFDYIELDYIDKGDLERKPYSVRAHPSDFYFVVGAEYRSNKKELYTFKLFDSDLDELDELDIDVHVYATGWSHDGDYIAIGSSSDTRVFSFDDESISQIHSLSLGSGYKANRDALCWDQTGQFYVLGIDHASSSKVRVLGFNGSTITAKDSINTGADSVMAVDWSKTGSWIAFGTDGKSNQLRICDYNSSTNSLTQRCVLDVGGPVYSVHWNSDATRLVVGKAKGSGTTELIKERGINAGSTELAVYYFDKNKVVLKLDKGIQTSTDINSVRWARSDSYIACGDAAKKLSVYSYVPSLAGTDIADFVVLDNVIISLDANMSWKMGSTVQGDCLVYGGGHRLTLEDSGAIEIAQGAQLQLSDLELVGLTNSSFKCLASDSSIIFRNCRIVLNDDFLFDNGSILFDEDVIFTGTHTFIYSSPIGSTIDSNATLAFDLNTTLSYDPSDSYNMNLLFTDETSVLKLKGSTLHVTATGMKLTKGTLRIKDKCSLVSELDGEFHLEEGLILGNNDLDDDIKCEICAGGVLEVSSGALSYKNMNSSSLSMVRDLSAIRIASGGKLKLHQTLDAGEGLVCFSDNTRLARATGKELLGNVHILGSLYYEVCYNSGSSLK